MNKINVAIADDNQRTVEMMTELLEQESDIEVIASADDGEEALRIIKEKQPDVGEYPKVCVNLQTDVR